MVSISEGDFHAPFNMLQDDSEVGRMVCAILFMKDNLVKIIREITSVLTQMGDGNYEVSLDQNYVGEFGEIKESFNKISQKIRHTLQSLRDMSNQIKMGSIWWFPRLILRTVLPGSLPVLRQPQNRALHRLPALLQLDKGIAIADETAANISEVMAGAQTATQKMGQISKLLQQNVEYMKQVDADLGEIQVWEIQKKVNAWGFWNTGASSAWREKRDSRKKDCIRKRPVLE